MLKTPKLKFQSDYNEVMSEAHARPPFEMNGSQNVFYLAFSCSAETAQYLRMLISATPEDTGHRHVIGTLEGYSVKFEQHTEFISLFLLVDKHLTKDEILQRLGQKINFDKLELSLAIWLQVCVTKKQFNKLASRWPLSYGGLLRAGGEVRSSMRVDEFGFVEFVVLRGSARPTSIGRRVQRIIELETYRVMALRGLPLARSKSVELAKIEKRLEEISASLNRVAHGGDDQSEETFKELCSLSNKANHLHSGSRFRYSASRAYFDLVEQRINWLSEEKIEEIQMLGAFVRSRLKPAIATIESTGKRQQDLVEDIARVFALLRTRLELNVAADNQAVLRTMSQRHDQQVKISETVEGLSAIAITYYAVGLVSYFLKVVASEKIIPLSQSALTAISIPFVFGLVILALRRMRSKWH